jgi:hypothetical protein
MARPLACGLAWCENARTGLFALSLADDIVEIPNAPAPADSWRRGAGDKISVDAA